MSTFKGKRLLPLLIIVVSLTVFGCLWLYLFDNKYTADSPQAGEGLLILNDTLLNDYPVLFLTEGWEYYSGYLLTPEDFGSDGAPAPDSYIYIGQYGGFDMDIPGASPHGSASYRLRILLPDTPGEFLLELPEIFSAYRLYLNGEPTVAMGDPDPAVYRPETGNKTVSIKAGGEIEILIAVSDFSHLYSGMVYPPAFGEPGAVLFVLNIRFALRCLAAAFALAVGLIAVFTSLLGSKNKLTVLFGLICICFVGFTSYPIVRTISSGHPALYVIEYISICALLIVVILLLKSLFGYTNRIHSLTIGFGGAMSIFSSILPFLLPLGNLWLMVLYSYLIYAYKILTAAVLTHSAIVALRRGRTHAGIVFCGLMILNTALVMDRVLPDFEPIVGGWFYEIAAFALILCIGLAIAREVAGKYKENAVLSERQLGMERLAVVQKANYMALMETVEETKAARHDLRHHFIVMEKMLASRDYDRLSDYVSRHKASVSFDSPIGFTQNVVVDALLRHYARLAAEQAIDYNVQAELGHSIEIVDSDLCSVLSNLLENSVEACQRMTGRERFIEINIAQKKNTLSIYLENSADRDTIRSRGGHFYSVKEQGRIGYGLSSISTIAEKYSGEAEFDYDETRSVFKSVVLLVSEASTY